MFERGHAIPTGHIASNEILLVGGQVGFLAAAAAIAVCGCTAGIGTTTAVVAATPGPGRTPVDQFVTGPHKFVWCEDALFEKGCLLQGRGEHFAGLPKVSHGGGGILFDRNCGRGRGFRRHVAAA